MTAHTASLLSLDPASPQLVMALTHPSFSNEKQTTLDNQRLEFLGDAVLGLCISELLYGEFPEADEGTLTRLRARIIRSEHLAEWGRQAGIASEIRLGRGASQGGLAESDNVVADAVEACIAAAFLDGGLDLARRACHELARPVLEEWRNLGLTTRDPKSDLQELFQSRSLGLPSYEVVASGGPAHDKWFEVRVSVGAQSLAVGRGRSKRQAERAAAEQVLGDPDLVAQLGKVELEAERGDNPC